MRFLSLYKGTSEKINFISGPLVVDEAGYTPSVGSHPFDKVTETINAYFISDDNAEINTVLRELDALAWIAKRYAEADGETGFGNSVLLYAQTDHGDMMRSVVIGLSWAWRSPLGTGDEYSNRRALTIQIERIAGWRSASNLTGNTAVSNGSVVAVPLFDTDAIGTTAVFNYVKMSLTNSDATTIPSRAIFASISSDNDLQDFVLPARKMSDATNVDEISSGLPFYPTDTSIDSADKCAVLLNGDEVEGEIVAVGNGSFYSAEPRKYLVVVRALLKTHSGGTGEDRGDPMLTVISSLYTGQDAATDQTAQIIGSFTPVYDNTIYPIGVVAIPRVADQPVELIDRLLIRLDYLGSIGTKWDLYIDAIILVPIGNGILVIDEPMQWDDGNGVYLYQNDVGLIHVAAPVQRSTMRVGWLPFSVDADAMQRRKKYAYIIGELSYYDSTAAEWKPTSVSVMVDYTEVCLDLLLEE